MPIAFILYNSAFEYQCCLVVQAGKVSHYNTSVSGVAKECKFISFFLDGFSVQELQACSDNCSYRQLCVKLGNMYNLLYF